MHEYRARPTFAGKRLVPAHHSQLPLLDVFIIKMFAAPCKFAEPPAAVDKSRPAVSGVLTPPHQQTIESLSIRAIAPDMRTELTRLATSTLEFLGRVSHMGSAGEGIRLLSEKASLLKSLASWLNDLGLVYKDSGSPGSESLSVSFLRFFHQALKVILLGALDSSPDLATELRTENDRLQGIAKSIDERVKGYGGFKKTGNDQGELSNVI